MKKKMKAMIAGGALLCACAVPAQAASTNMALVVNDEAIYSDAAVGQPYISDSGRTMLPLRIISESLQCGVTYVNGNVYIENERNHYSAIFENGADYFYANGERIALDAPMTISAEGRAYVPARAFAETLGTIDWDNASRTVTITSDADWVINDDPYYAKEISIEGTSLTFNLVQGETSAVRDHLYVFEQNSEEKIGAYLSAPEEIADWFVPANKDKIDLHNAKLIDGQPYLGISMMHSVSNNFTMDIVSAPADMTTDETGMMTYIGTIASTSDYTTDGDYLYSTAGLHQGPFAIDPNRLNIDKVGDRSSRVSVDVDFAINECKLSMDGDHLVAVDLDGNRHVLNVEELLSEAK